MSGKFNTFLRNSNIDFIFLFGIVKYMSILRHNNFNNQLLTPNHISKFTFFLFYYKYYLAKKNNRHTQYLNTIGTYCLALSE